MSPRKAHQKIERHIVEGIRNRREKLLAGPYHCFSCGNESLRILINHEQKIVKAKCRCGLEKMIEYQEGKEGLDYYNFIIDN